MHCWYTASLHVWGLHGQIHQCVTGNQVWGSSDPILMNVPDFESVLNDSIKLGWALFVTYTIIQSIMRSEMCSLHLTHPSVHTWSSGQPTVQLPAGAGIRTHNLRLPRVSSPTLYPLGQRLPTIPKRFPELDAFCKQRLFQTKMIRWESDWWLYNKTRMKCFSLSLVSQQDLLNSTMILFF